MKNKKNKADTQATVTPKLGVAKKRVAEKKGTEKKSTEKKGVVKKGAVKKSAVKINALKKSAAKDVTEKKNAARLISEKKKSVKKDVKQSREVKSKKIKIIPLGGLNEIGKNLTVFEYEDDIVILDCGLAFPSDDMPGVDMVIPDVTYLEKHKSKIRGIVLTHGHEDHIGATPYILKDYNVPVYGTRLTLGLVSNKLKEHKMLDSVKLINLNAGETIKLGSFKVEFIRSNHSIADSVFVALHTPAGVILHSGDFKIDCTPINGEMIDLARIGELGKNGLLALMMESTNVERAGYSMSESTVGETFDRVFDGCNQRILVATFASNIHRVQQIINSAEKHKRKVAVSGRSMINVLSTAMELGYMRINPKTLIDLDEINRYPKNKVVIITTGSQGETMSALSRMAYSGHKQVVIDSGDLVIISAHPIPGNDKHINNVINELFKKGANVIYESLADIHVSGHACREELKIILGLAKPKYFIPVHGEHRHLIHSKELAKKMGINNIFIMDLGQVLELSWDSAKITGSVPAGGLLVDGLGVGDVGGAVLRDRKRLAEDGLIMVFMGMDSRTRSIVTAPDIISRGFIYVKDNEDFMEKLKSLAADAVQRCENNNISDWNTIKNQVKSSMRDYIFSKTKRTPMILSIIIEV